MKHFKNSQKIDCSTDHGSSYADREKNSPSFDVEYIYGFVGWGSAGKFDDVIPSRAVQDGGYALPWQRYDNNKMAAICYSTSSTVQS